MELFEELEVAHCEENMKKFAGHQLRHHTTLISPDAPNESNQPGSGPDNFHRSASERIATTGVSAQKVLSEMSYSSEGEFFPQKHAGLQERFQEMETPAPKTLHLTTCQSVILM